MFSCLGNANQNYTEISSHPNQNGYQPESNSKCWKGKPSTLLVGMSISPVIHFWVCKESQHTIETPAHPYPQ
jgi:hypothetical protein